MSHFIQTKDPNSVDLLTKVMPETKCTMWRTVKQNTLQGGMGECKSASCSILMGACESMDTQRRYVLREKAYYWR